MENWKDVKDYEGLYQVSDLGNVRVKDREVIGKSGSSYTKAGKVLNYEAHRDGYYRVSLRKYSKSNHFFVHRLVAQTFIDNPNNHPVVDHINNDKMDNRVENLRWCTVQENTRWAIDDGLIVPKTGEDHYNSKLTEDVVCEIKKTLFESDLTQTQIAAKFNISTSRISEIKNGKTWKDVGTQYDYTERNKKKGLSREVNPATKLSTEQVQEIYKLLEEKMKQREIAKLYGVSQSLIGNLNKQRKQ